MYFVNNRRSLLSTDYVASHRLVHSIIFLKKYLFFHTDILTSTKLNYLQYSISMGKTNETLKQYTSNNFYES